MRAAVLPFPIMPTRLDRIADLEKRLAELKVSNRNRESQLRNKLSRLASAERTRERKLRTRRLILIGSVVEKDIDLPNSALLQRLDQVLDRDRDRALFDLPPRSTADLAPPPAPLSGWTPARVKGGVWGARFQGDTRTLPSGLEGLAISVTARNGNSWISTVTEVIERSSDLVLVRAQKLDS